MGSRTFGELLLRPSTFTRMTPASRFTPAWTAQRYISNTSSKPAAQPARQENPETATTPEVAAGSPKPTSRVAASQAIDDLFAGPPSHASTSPDSTPVNRVFGAEFSKPSPRGRLGRAPNLNFNDMILPDTITNPSLENKPSPSTLVAQQTATFADYPRLNPTYGRSVDLDPSRGRDIVRGIGMLGSLMARNKIKGDFNKQRFHERGGLKRKRLNSERWRARFKKGFQGVTGRVIELTRKGW
ncbi:hypothetical protein BU25DRAFT_400192 [Macroventuria anomochaeta]|uniref:Uncharacterized protein n=1 Tax=Macroventuria anomochaeta TaxID=301207 RepID=A0ACB6RRU4_9PLEO|nr:uncharacterized protein BU25DRAFT_400192 [Macroventuria anomochaeta]KAF2623647.1 hypothetical protein BU25DRAFT_400192 [Macroventuria anomochaeta]